MNNIDAAITATFGNKLRLRISGICIQNNQILLVKHHSINETGILWAPPGGGMQFGESAIATLEREFLEETGLRIKVGKFLFVNEYFEAPLHAVELFFEVSLITDKISKGIDPELGQDQIITDVQFVHGHEIKSGNPKNYHSCLHQVHALEDLLQLNGYFQHINP